jgi:hypothetical protein
MAKKPQAVRVLRVSIYCERTQHHRCSGCVCGCHPSHDEVIQEAVDALEEE